VFGLTPLILLGVRAWSRSVPARPIVVFAGVVLIATCPQVLANGTAPDGDSFLARKDYQSVFLGRSRDYGEQYREAISVTDAVLRITGSRAKLMSWSTDPESLAIGAMFLNMFGGTVVNGPTAAYLRGSAPTHLVVVSRNHGAALSLRGRLARHGIHLTPGLCVTTGKAGSSIGQFIVCPWRIAN